MKDLPQGPDINSYKLTATDVDKAKRNFPGYAKEMEYPLEDMIRLGQDSSGTTDTDSKTHEMGYQKSGYTRIYQ